MKIVLIGYRGTGKSVVGALLAERLGMKCIAMDAEIVQRAGMSIPDIVEQNGWKTFRDMESDLARELAEIDNIVIDTGGGVIERPENIEALQAGALIVWLKASVNTIVSRIQGGYGKAIPDRRKELYRRGGGSPGKKESEIQERRSIRD